MNISRTVFALLLPFIATLAACNAADKSAAQTTQNSPVSQASAIIATVNGETIPAARLQLILERFAGQAAPQAIPPEMRQKIIDQLVTQTLLTQEAEKQKLDSKPEVAEQLKLMRTSLLANAYLQDLQSRQTVSDAQVATEYEALKNGPDSQEYRVRHILVADAAQAKELLTQLQKQPGEFAALAKKYTLDAGSRERGGELDWIKASTVVPEFGQAMQAMKKGELSKEPVHSQFGYHLLLLEDVRPVEIPPLDLMQPSLKEKLQQAAVQKALEELKARAKIQITAPTPAPAGEDASSAKH